MPGAALKTTEGFVEVTGGRIWYQRVGEAHGTPLITIHGGPAVPHDYLEPLAALGRQRPVVFYDQLGCGNSDQPTDVTLWRVDRFVEEVGLLMDALGFDRAHLLGQSWGTNLAVEFALASPNRVVSLVLADPSLSIPRWVEDANRLRSALPPEVIATLDRHEAAGTMDSEEYQAAVMEFYRRHVCRLDPWPEPFTRSVQRTNAEVYGYMGGASEFNITGILKDFDQTPALGRLTQPALLLCGRYDEATPETTAWYHSLIPGAELVVFEESAHVPHLEEPERFLQVVRDFLNRSDP